MTISIRLPAEEEALLEKAARELHISKSEFVRRSIAAYVAKVAPDVTGIAEIDARYIGQGGGLRKPESVRRKDKRAILERLREKHGYTD